MTKVMQDGEMDTQPLQRAVQLHSEETKKRFLNQSGSNFYRPATGNITGLRGRDYTDFIRIKWCIPEKTQSKGLQMIKN